MLGLFLLFVALMLGISIAKAQEGYEVGGGATGSYNGGAGLGQGGCCLKEFCGPIFGHCTPNSGCHCPCRKPLCDPCALENYGYYPVYWRPWKQQVNWSNCSVPPAIPAPSFHPPGSTLPIATEEMLAPPTIKTP
jgi:hypothetical protein